MMRKKSAEKSAGRIKREYECFVIHIHNFKTPLLARLDAARPCALRALTSLGLGPGPSASASACFLSIPHKFPRENCFVLRVPV